MCVWGVCMLCMHCMLWYVLLMTLSFEFSINILPFSIAFRQEYQITFFVSTFNCVYNVFTTFK